MVSDKNLIKITTSFRKGMLGKNPPKGRCFMVCLALHGYLGVMGICSELVVIDLETPNTYTNHSFLRLPDKRILDPTADQFPESGLPAVYLGELPALYLEWMKQCADDSEVNHKFLKILG